MGDRSQVVDALLAQRGIPPAETFATASKLADLFGSHIDQPLASQYTNPMYGPNTPAKGQFFDIAPSAKYGIIPDDLGVLQNPPQYWGSRMTLPMSGGDKQDSYARPPLPPQGQALQQAVYGELIRRGYPVLGGSEMVGRGKTFKPIGFGDKP